LLSELRIAIFVCSQMTCPLTLCWSQKYQRGDEGKPSWRGEQDLFGKDQQLITMRIIDVVSRRIFLLRH